MVQRARFVEPSLQAERLDCCHEVATAAALSAGGNTAGSDAPSIFTAVQEQIGLKLEPAKTSVDYLVIDHIEPPEAN